MKHDANDSEEDSLPAVVEDLKEYKMSPDKQQKNSKRNQARHPDKEPSAPAKKQVKLENAEAQQKPEKAKQAQKPEAQPSKKNDKKSKAPADQATTTPENAKAETIQEEPSATAPKTKKGKGRGKGKVGGYYTENDKGTMVCLGSHRKQLSFEKYPDQEARNAKAQDWVDLYKEYMDAGKLNEFSVKDTFLAKS